MSYKFMAIVALLGSTYLAYIFKLPGFVAKIGAFAFQDMTHTVGTLIFILIIMLIWFPKRHIDNSTKVSFNR